MRHLNVSCLQLIIAGAQLIYGACPSLHKQFTKLHSLLAMYKAISVMRGMEMHPQNPSAAGPDTVLQTCAAHAEVQRQDVRFLQMLDPRATSAFHA